MEPAIKFDEIHRLFVRYEIKSYICFEEYLSRFQGYEHIPKIRSTFCLRYLALKLVFIFKQYNAVPRNINWTPKS